MFPSDVPTFFQRRPGKAKCEQVRSLCITRFEKKLGSLDQKEMEAIDKKLLMILNLKNCAEREFQKQLIAELENKKAREKLEREKLEQEIVSLRLKLDRERRQRIDYQEIAEKAVTMLKKYNQPSNYVRKSVDIRDFTSQQSVPPKGFTN